MSSAMGLLVGASGNLSIPQNCGKKCRTALFHSTDSISVRDNAAILALVQRNGTSSRPLNSSIHQATYSLTSSSSSAAAPSLLSTSSSSTSSSSSLGSMPASSILGGYSLQSRNSDISVAAKAKAAVLAAKKAASESPYPRGGGLLQASQAARRDLATEAANAGMTDTVSVLVRAAAVAAEKEIADDVEVAKRRKV